MADIPTGKLRREVGVFGATMMGIGSMIGAGVFVSIGITAGIAGPAVLLPSCSPRWSPPVTR
jgi:APA family basic amino acid/polyamine antiporter